MKYQDQIKKGAFIAFICMGILGGGMNKVMAGSCGTDCTGGTWLVKYTDAQGKQQTTTLNSYLAERPFNDVQPVLAPLLAELRAIDPKSKFASALESEAKNLSWFYSDLPLDDLGINLTSVAIKDKEMMAGQTPNGIVVIKRDLYKQQANPVRLQSVVEEILQRRFRTGVGVNQNIKIGNMYKAVDFLAKLAIGVHPAPAATSQQLREKLAAWGFETENYPQGPMPQPNLEKEQMVEIPLSLDGKLITLENARKAKDHCMFGEKAPYPGTIRSTMDAIESVKNSVYGKLMRGYLGSESESRPVLGNWVYYMESNSYDNFGRYEDFMNTSHIHVVSVMKGTEEERNWLLKHGMPAEFHHYTFSDADWEGSIGSKLSANIKKRFSVPRDEEQRYVNDPRNGWTSVYSPMPSAEKYNQDHYTPIESVTNIPYLKTETLSTDHIYKNRNVIDVAQRLDRLTFVVPKSVMDNEGKVLMKVAIPDASQVQIVDGVTIDAKAYMQCVQDEVKKYLVSYPLANEASPAAGEGTWEPHRPGI